MGENQQSRVRDKVSERRGNIAQTKVIDKMREKRQNSANQCQRQSETERVRERKPESEPK